MVRKSAKQKLGAEFRSEVPRVIDRLSETLLIYQIVHRDVRRAWRGALPVLAMLVGKVASDHTNPGLSRDRTDEEKK